MSQLFRERYADLPRIIRESDSPEAAISAIDHQLLMAAKEQHTRPIESTLAANVLNGLPA